MNGKGKYILDGHKVIECNDLMKWAEWFETAERHIAKDTINDVTVSTVFLGLDHNFEGGKPILFETLVFGGKYDGEMDRYSTWDEAEKGHKEFVEKLEQEQK